MTFNETQLRTIITALRAAGDLYSADAVAYASTSLEKQAATFEALAKTIETAYHL